MRVRRCCWLTNRHTCQSMGDIMESRGESKSPESGDLPRHVSRTSLENHHLMIGSTFTVWGTMSIIYTRSLATRFSLSNSLMHRYYAWNLFNTVGIIEIFPTRDNSLLPNSSTRCMQLGMKVLTPSKFSTMNSVLHRHPALPSMGIDHYSSFRKRFINLSYRLPPERPVSSSLSLRVHRPR